MRAAKLLVALCICVAVVSAAYGEEKRWADEAELSFVSTGGNTEVVSLSGKNLLKYTLTDKLLGTWRLGALYGETDNVKTAERYFTDLRLDYSFSAKIYFFGMGGWLQDEFTGIESRYFIGPGAGYRFLTGPKHFLDAEAGINFVTEDYTNNTEEEFLEGRLYGLYQYSFSEKNKFSQSLEFLYDFDDSDNYRINSETAFITALSNYLSLKTSYEIKHDNEPVPATLKETDTILSVTLVVNF
jgi:putative salt-induced outer membrane protein